MIRPTYICVKFGRFLNIVRAFILASLIGGLHCGVPLFYDDVRGARLPF